MGTRAIVIATLLLGLLLAAAGGVYAYDRSKAEEIAPGVHAGGIAVGGMSPGQARATLRRTVLEPLSRPVVVRAKGRRFTLTPESAGVGVDLDGSVRAALSRSREGNMLTRTVRSISGGRVRADVPLDVSHSEAGIDRLVRRVGKAVNRKAVDADVDLEHGDVKPRPSRNGRRLLAARLEHDVRTRLLDTGPREPVRARTKVVKPKVSSRQLKKKFPAVLVINRSSFQLTLYKNLEKAKTYGIAVGQVGLETPAGLYEVQNKAVNPAWHVPNSDWAGDLAGQIIPGDDPSNPIKARWMGIYDGAGIHGTAAADSIGTAASHGCIRMRIPEVIELFDEVPVGAPVYIS